MASDCMKKTFILASIILLCLLQGCGEGAKEASGSGIYFDTVIDIKVYGDDADRMLSGCFDICKSMEKTLSAHDEESELYKLNHRSEGETSVEISEDLAECISEGLYYSEVSDGVFDITILPLSGLWDFNTEEPEVPSDAEISDALKKVDHRRVHLNGNTVSFDDPDIKIDLGGIAKGFVSAKLKEYLKSEGCSSAIINLGGNVSTVGSRPDGSEWVVGIQEPYAGRGTVFDTVKVRDGCVVSSGTYERYFTVGDRRYHHILDPKTGYPADTGLFQATVTGDDDTLCDALSTICVLLGSDASKQLIEKEGWDVKILFIDTDTTGTWYPQKP